MSNTEISMNISNKKSPENELVLNLIIIRRFTPVYGIKIWLRINKLSSPSNMSHTKCKLRAILQGFQLLSGSNSRDKKCCCTNARHELASHCCWCSCSCCECHSEDWSMLRRRWTRIEEAEGKSRAHRFKWLFVEVYEWIAVDSVARKRQTEASRARWQQGDMKYGNGWMLASKILYW